MIWAGRDRSRLTHVEVFADERRQWVSENRNEGEHFDAIGTDGIVFSDGGRVVYPAVRAGAWYVVDAGRTLGPWDAVADITVSSDGARVAFAAQTKNGWRAVVDGVVSDVFDELQAGTVQFSHDGAHVAFVGVRGDCSLIVVDGVTGPCRADVRSMRVTDAGTVAATVLEGGKKTFVWQPDRLSSAPPPDEIDEIGEIGEIGEWVVTADGARSAVTARVADGWKVLVDGVGAEACTAVSGLRFGDEGRRVAWVCVEGGQSAVVVDGVAGPSFFTASPPLLAAHAPDFAYVGADRRGEWVVTIDDTMGPFAHVHDVALPARGGFPTFVARSAGVTHVVHGDTITPVALAVDHSLVVSDDGNHWALIAGDPAVRELWFVVDGARVRRIAAAELFDDRNGPLHPWLTRELRECVQLSSSTMTKKEAP